MMVTDRGARANHGLTAWWEETIDKKKKHNSLKLFMGLS